ncbi:MAG: serine--tRNA ligase [Verrucomicrobia bacterium]|nr:MAG: serine--tRNA ligase [Verrucomicrobiota bacterium]
MIDPKTLRENPENIRRAITDKRNDCDLDAVLKADADWRAKLIEVEQLRSARKTANTEMAQLTKGSPEFMAKVKDLKATSARMKAEESVLKDLEAGAREAVLTVPNIAHESVPVAPDPSGNQVVFTWGEAGPAPAHAVPHDEIPWFSRIVDFDRGSKVTGAGFPFFVGPGARLVRALVQFFLNEAGDAGYEEVSTPLFVNADSATATGALPDKEGQMYQTVEDSLYAIPTAEVPLTNFFRDEILDASSLPVYRCAYSPCFRREAGSYGKDVRGLNRVHQFDKVELVKWVHPSSSYEELEKLRRNSEQLLQKLGLPYRVLLMCTGDLGFTQSKKYDLEVWSIGQQRWLEVSSCSNFEAFQARRAGIRYRSEETGRPEYVHTLNGSALAIPRTFVAILENNLQPNGRVSIPEVLRPWFGADEIGFDD